MSQDKHSFGDGAPHLWSVPALASDLYLLDDRLTGD